MYVVTQEGKKLPVDDSSIDYENQLLPLNASRLKWKLVSQKEHRW